MKEVAEPGAILTWASHLRARSRRVVLPWGTTARAAHGSVSRRQEGRPRALRSPANQGENRMSAVATRLTALKVAPVPGDVGVGLPRVCLARIP